MLSQHHSINSQVNLFSSFYLSSFEGFIRRLRGLVSCLLEEKYWLPSKMHLTYTHTLFICVVISIQMWDKEGEPQKKGENWKKRVQFNLKGFGIVLMLNIQSWPFLSQTRLVPTWVNPALTWPTVSLSAICRFFLPPQGTLGHSWQETQIGFKAALSRLKNEPSNPEQMEFCVLFSHFLFPLLPSPTLPLFCSPSAGKQVRVLAEEATRQNTDWQLSGD